MNSLTNGLFFIHPLLLYFSYILVLTYSLFSNQKSKVLNHFPETDNSSTSCSYICLYTKNTNQTQKTWFLIRL